MSKQQSAREAITDGVIAARVKVALAEDPITASYDIRVETLAGIVELTGFVETSIVRMEALHVVERIHGVRGIENSLDVRTPENQLDVVDSSIVQ